MIDFDKIDPFAVMTGGEKYIIKSICKIQLKSIREVLRDSWRENSDVDLTLVLNNYDCSLKHIRQQLRNTRRRFKYALDDPILLLSLTKWEINIFRHILFQTEDEYKNLFFKDVYKLWSRLFALEAYCERKNKEKNLISKDNEKN